MKTKLITDIYDKPDDTLGGECLGEESITIDNDDVENHSFVDIVVTDEQESACVTVNIDDLLAALSGFKTQKDLEEERELFYAQRDK